MARSAPAPEKLEAVERELARGATLDEAAQRTGVSRRTVARWLERGLVVRRRLHVMGDAAGGDLPLPEEPEAVEDALAEMLLRRALAGDVRAATFILRARFGWRT